jgi:hypothetical protein
MQDWTQGYDQFIQEIIRGKTMKMKSYAVTIEVSGRVTVYVTAPDYEEAEEIAIEQAQNENWNDWDLELEVNGSEEDSDD